MGTTDALVRLDLNNPVFQEQLFALQKLERHAAIDTLRKIRQLSWGQLYQDKGLKWEKIVSAKPPQGIDALIRCESPNHDAARLTAKATSSGC